jgi:hypothetical protein
LGEDLLGEGVGVVCWGVGHDDRCDQVDEFGFHGGTVTTSGFEQAAGDERGLLEGPWWPFVDLDTHVYPSSDPPFDRSKA